MRTVDLRSDTVTLPTPEMIDAIRHAELGDDIRDRDPTVERLEEIAAEKLGKEGGLLVVSGTQGNLVSLMTHTKRGDAVILESGCHIIRAELGGLSAVAGVLPQPLPGRLGILDPQDVEEAIVPGGSPIEPKTTLVCIENTHNRAGGTVWTPRQIEAVASVSKAHSVAVHMDGSRIFNAAVALNSDVRELAKNVDSVMFCLSKGLSAPVGSIVVGNTGFIEAARRVRRMLGGGMRQAGIIAAPGIVALETMIDRLRDDHVNAQILADGLMRIPGISINRETVQTNIVIFNLDGLNMTVEQFLSKLAKLGVKASSMDGVRMVTHRGIEKEDIDYALEAVSQVVANGR